MSEALPEVGGEGLSLELLDLMEHEKSIEQGITSMLDMGYAFEKIRDGRKYRAKGYTTFEAYCQERWGLSRQHVNQVISACQITRELETVVSIVPSHESQVRPLKALPDPEQRAEAWSEAVEEAGGDQPTAKQVEKAVAKRQPPKKDHPAPFSDPILDQVAEHLKETGQTGTVLDPFAGTGRVHELREKAGVKTLGIEIEPEWAAKHPDTIEGNALELTNTIEPGTIDAIATSPTYGNRMADHHDAKDDSVRLTYKHTLGRDLNEDNSGQLQWGDEYKRFHQTAWAEAVETLKPGGTLTLNIKNHIREDLEVRVAEWHLDTLYGLGMHLVAQNVVLTKGLMAGANAGSRTPAEYVMTFRKDEP